MSVSVRLTEAERRAYKGGARGYLDGISPTQTFKRLGLDHGGNPSDEYLAAARGYVDMAQHTARQEVIQEYAAEKRAAALKGEDSE